MLYETLIWNSQEKISFSSKSKFLKLSCQLLWIWQPVGGSREEQGASNSKSFPGEEKELRNTFQGFSWREAEVQNIFCYSEKHFPWEKKELNRFLWIRVSFSCTCSKINSHNVWMFAEPVSTLLSQNLFNYSEQGSQFSGLKVVSTLHLIAMRYCSSLCSTCSFSTWGKSTMKRDKNLPS